MQSSNLPFKDRIYDCQNLAFLLAVSFLPIISKCCLNILADFYFFRSLQLDIEKMEMLSTHMDGSIWLGGAGVKLQLFIHSWNPFTHEILRNLYVVLYAKNEFYTLCDFFRTGHTHTFAAATTGWFVFARAEEKHLAYFRARFICVRVWGKLAASTYTYGLF